MFLVETKGDALKITFNGRLVIRHTHENPFIEACKGRWESFGKTVRDIRSESLVPLQHVQYDQGRSVLRFFGGDYSLSLHISEINGILRLAPQRATTGLNRIRLRFPSAQGTAVYGGGAHYSHLNLRGKTLPLWVGENRVFRRAAARPSLRMSGVGRLRSSCPIPAFFTEDQIFYAFESYGRTAFDFTGSRSLCTELWELPATIFIGLGKSPLDTVGQMTRVTGRQPVLPLWSIEGATLEAQGGSHAIAELLEKALTSGAKVSCVYIPDWSGGFTAPGGRRPFYDWIWNQDLYPKLDGFMRELVGSGIRTMAYINPHLSIEGRLFAECSVNGYLIQKPQGGNYISDMGGFMAGHLDLTNKDACAWFKDIVKKNILDLGFCGYYADGGDYLPPDAKLHSKENAVRLHNRWPLLWSKLNREIIRETGRTSDSYFLSRTGWFSSGTSGMLIHTGEHHTGWNEKQGLASALTAALNLSCSGIGLSAADCGGNVTFASTRSKELYFRWMELSAFSPVFRITEGDVQGWRIDSDEDTLRFFARMSRIHAALGTYIRACIKENANEGHPVMRPLFMNFPSEPRFRECYDRYMLGNELLVYPVLRRGLKTMRIYLPEGSWQHLWSGKQFGGQSEHVMSVPLGKPVVFFRPEGKFADSFEQLPHRIE